MYDLRVNGAIAVVFIGFLLAMVWIEPGSTTVAMLVVGIAMTWWSWPGRVGRHTPHEAAIAGAGENDVIVYWRPG